MRKTNKELVMRALAELRDVETCVTSYDVACRDCCMDMEMTQVRNALQRLKDDRKVWWDSTRGWRAQSLCTQLWTLSHCR